jgi:hypothetical protein
VLRHRGAQAQAEQRAAGARADLAILARVVGERFEPRPSGFGERTDVAEGRRGAGAHVGIVVVEHLDERGHVLAQREAQLLEGVGGRRADARVPVAHPLCEGERSLARGGTEVRERIRRRPADVALLVVQQLGQRRDRALRGRTHPRERLGGHRARGRVLRAQHPDQPRHRRARVGPDLPEHLRGHQRRLPVAGGHQRDQQTGGELRVRLHGAAQPIADRPRPLRALEQLQQLAQARLGLGLGLALTAAAGVGGRRLVAAVPGPGGTGHADREEHDQHATPHTRQPCRHPRPPILQWIGGPGARPDPTAEGGLDPFSGRENELSVELEP